MFATIYNLTNENEKLRKALQTIVDWKLPETGLFWPNQDGSDSDRPMSYAAAWGMLGEREYIRTIAAEALNG